MALAFILGTTWPSPAAASASAALASDPQALSQSGQWIVDRDGRVILLHGGNVSLPGSAADIRKAPWSDQTPTRMAAQGFNAVRLVMFLSDLMPQPGQIDQHYLERVATTVQAYKTAGIRTLLDFHQDEYSAVVGVRGMPAWAVFTDGHTRMPGIEFPMGYFQDPAVQHAFDNFWANHAVPGTGKGVQDLYVAALAVVATRFRGEPAVIGIDVMNEPATGSLCPQPDPALAAKCPDLEPRLLAPFYKKASRAIADAAPGMLIFVEPFMLQGALGTPFHTPIFAPPGSRGLSYHNYGPVKATRDKVNDGALAHARESAAALLNTEWGFDNDPVAIAGQAADFDARLISWLAWPRGAFEALVDPSLPDRDNGNRTAILRAYARAYPQAVAGTPLTLSVDPDSGTTRLRYTTRLPSGRTASTGLETDIAIPEVNYPQGYSATATGARIISPAGAPRLRLRNLAGAREVEVIVHRTGALPALPRATAASNVSDAALAGLPPIPDAPLARHSLIGHIVVTPGGRAALDASAPGIVVGISQLHGWERMTLVEVQHLAGGALDETRMAAIDTALAKLKVTPGPMQVRSQAAPLDIDSLTSDLLANPAARAILAREAPGLESAPQRALFPQTRLHSLQAAMPDILTLDALDRIAKALAALR